MFRSGSRKQETGPVRSSTRISGWTIFFVIIVPVLFISVDIGSDVDVFINMVNGGLASFAHANEKIRNTTTDPYPYPLTLIPSTTYILTAMKYYVEVTEKAVLIIASGTIMFGTTNGTWKTERSV